MSDYNNNQKTYFDMAEHNSVQVIITALIFMVIFYFSFVIVFPLLESLVFEGFLSGRVYNDGKLVSVSLESATPRQYTQQLFAWAVDIYLNTPAEARYWFNPIVSLALPVSFFALMISFSISAMLPFNLGYMRHKIEREIANVIDKISLARYGYHAESGQHEIVDEIKSADLRDIHDLSKQWRLNIEDIKIIHKAIKWRDGNFTYKLFHLMNAFKLYMRFHFTQRYSSTVLGFVYIGAAVLIIIVGLRGLKFIPPTQPSFVLFALGLEFVLLLIYALTLMFSRDEEESEMESGNFETKSLSDSGEFGSSREVENLLRVFIKKQDKDI